MTVQKNGYLRFEENGKFLWKGRKNGGERNGTFLQQLECGYEFPALIYVWIASAGVLEWFISTSGETTGQHVIR